VLPGPLGVEYEGACHRLAGRGRLQGMLRRELVYQTSPVAATWARRYEDGRGLGVSYLLYCGATRQGRAAGLRTEAAGQEESPSMSLSTEARGTRV